MSMARESKMKTATTQEQQKHCSGKYQRVLSSLRKSMTRAAPQMANATTARARTIPRWMSQAESRNRTRDKWQARRNIPGTNISYTSSSRKSRARAVPRKGNATTARAQTILSRMDQAEARQSQMSIKRHARRNISGTSLSKR